MSHNHQLPHIAVLKQGAGMVAGGNTMSIEYGVLRKDTDSEEDFPQLDKLGDKGHRYSES